MKQGLADLSDAFITKLPGAIQQCENTGKSVVDVVKGLEAFKSPASYAFHIGKDILVNGKQIYGDIEQAVADWKVQDYNDFGFQIGSALKLVVIGIVLKLLLYVIYNTSI